MLIFLWFGKKRRGKRGASVSISQTSIRRAAWRGARDVGRGRQGGTNGRCCCAVKRGGFFEGGEELKVFCVCEGQTVFTSSPYNTLPHLPKRAIPVPPPPSAHTASIIQQWAGRKEKRVSTGGGGRAPPNRKPLGPPRRQLSAPRPFIASALRFFEAQSTIWRAPAVT